MKIQQVDDVLARLEQASKAEPEGIFAFDGDGTLWSGDVGEDYFHALVARADFRAPALAALRATATGAGLDDAGDGSALAARIFDEYLAGRFPEERICELMAWASAGWTRKEVSEFAANVVANVGLSSRLHAEVVRIVGWARRAALEIYVVSASPRSVIEHAAELVGVEPSHVIAATPDYDQRGVMLATLSRPIPYGPGKVAGIRALLGPRPINGAFGDNVFDLAMLSEARVAVAVRPKERLRARSGEVAHLVELARE